jgi:transcriptional regulator with XRE-family HTH domain
METFAERLVSFRKAQKLTQTDVAERIGKTKSAVAAYEASRVEPSMKDLVVMAEMFQCSIDELITGKKVSVLKTEDQQNENIEYYQKVIENLRETIHILSGKALVGKLKAYLMTQRVYMDTLLGTPGLN